MFQNLVIFMMCSTTCTYTQNSAVENTKLY